MKVPIFLIAFSLQILSAQPVSWVETFENQFIPSYFEGNISRFSILNKRLYLNHIFPTAQNETQIIRYTPIKKGEPLVWELQVALDFSPSPQNNLKFYLASSHPNLITAENAWFLQVGGETGNQDKISLYRQKDKQKLLLAQSEPGLFTGSTFKSTIKVSLSENNLWTIFTKADSSQNWVISFTYKGTEDLKSFYTGLLLNYTASRAKHFSFDNWKMDGLLPDESFPIVEKWLLKSPDLLQIYFSKPLDLLTNNPVNFQLNDANGKEISLILPFLDTINPYLLWIHFDSIKPNVIYQLKGTATDKSKNKNNFLISFERKAGFATNPGDILLSEILAIPNSSKQVEFIEIYNRSSKVLQLTSFKLIVNKSVLEVPELFISPEEYFILYAIKDSLYFRDIPSKYGAANFPALPNTGALVEITEKGISIDRMNYGHFPDWEHALSIGKSLERRSLTHLSDCILNWTVCGYEPGHSMGKKNSAQNIALPIFEPVIDHIFPITADSLLLFATMPLKNPDENDFQLFNLSTIELDNIISGTLSNKWIITLKNPINTKKIYSFSLLKGLKNCLGQENIHPQPIRIAMPEKPEIGEKIFINEILFDALPYQKPFIEIQANTKFPIDFQYIHWGNPNEVNYFHRVLFPYEPYAITENPNTLAAQYGYTADKSHIIEGKTPNLSRFQGNISLYYAENEMDIIKYDKSWHSAWLKTTTGVSLERKGVQNNGQISGSWTSAAGFKIGASPGKENTSSGKEQNLMKEKAVLAPFSFNGTDEIQYCKIASEYSGSQLNIRIFDTFGNEVNYLVKNQILGNRDEISWNGKQDNESNLEKGHYIWWIEILQANGVRTILKLLSNLE